MWSHLRGVAAAQQRGRHSPSDSENGPNPETTIRRRQSMERLIDLTNPCHRRHPPPEDRRSAKVLPMHQIHDLRR